MLATDAPTRFIVRGTKGGLTKRCGDPQEGQLVQGLELGSPAWGHDPDPVIITSSDERAPTALATPAGNYPAYYAAIRDAIRGDGAVPVTPAQATTLMAVIEAGIRSSVDGRVVRPDYTAGERSSWSPAVHSIPRGSSEPG